MEHSLGHSKLSEPSSTQSAQTPRTRNIWAWGIPFTSDSNDASSDAILFSSSVPDLPYGKCKGTEHLSPAVDDVFATKKQFGSYMGRDSSIDDLSQHLIGDILPDDEDELLAGIVNDFDHAKLQGHVEELEEYDVFGSSGGMELDSDPLESITIGTAKANIGDGTGNGSSQGGLLNGVGTVTGEHPYGEHPSRTLFVRNINSNVEDSELHSLFEPFGDIRSMYTATKHRGFVMISYYDIRAARAAMRALQNRPLRRRKLDIHFSIPKENPSDKDMNQGTLVIFNLEPAVSNEELLRIFGAYGEVREIRETPQKRHHRFIEFYDVRAAEAALRSLNKSDIAGKRVKLEPSRPGGARRSFIQQMNHDFDQDETRLNRFHLDSPIASSPPSLWPQHGSQTEHNQLKTLNETALSGGMSPLGGNLLSGVPSGNASTKSNSLKISPIGKDQNRINHTDNSNLLHGATAFQNSHSFPEHGGRILSASPLLSSVASSTSSASGYGTLNGPQFLWGNQITSREHFQSSDLHSPAGNSFLSNGHTQGQGVTFPNFPCPIGSSERHSQNHVGSAPSILPFESNFGYYSHSPETSYMRQAKFGSTGPSRIGGNLMTNFGLRPYMNTPSFQNGDTDTSLPNLRTMASHRWDNVSFGNPPFGGPGLIGFEGLVERSRIQAAGNTGSQEESRMQYQLDLEKIISGKDTRTTLMIKNIPNKYTSKMLLEVIDETHEGTYDFFYLPIDFKNKCNVGYAFINMSSPSYIVSFYQAFNGRKWEKFNSEKVVSLAYARIQGTAALINHFQNSSLMNEDNRCRPMLFHSKRLESGNQITLNGANISLHRQDGMIEEGDLREDPIKDNWGESQSMRPILNSLGKELG